MYTKLDVGLQNVERLIAESSGSGCHTGLDGMITEIHLGDETEASIDTEKNEEGPLKTEESSVMI